MTKQTTTQEQVEWLACAESFGYWCDHWAQVYDASARTWLRFHLWPAQLAVADALQAERLVVMLKARQLGMSWLTVAYGLWLMLFQPAATVLFFSKRDAEAVNLLSFRLRGIYGRLPPWMTAQAVLAENAHEFRLTNGSAALAFPTTGGRSYTGTLAVVDEADYCDLAPLLDAVKPTIDAGGQLVLLSTVDKASPGSAFKRIYQAAKAGENDYRPIFLPWTARPERDAAWYAGVRRDIVARSGHLDSLYAEYPASDVEALAPLAADARFAAEWLDRADATGVARLVGGTDMAGGVTDGPAPRFAFVEELASQSSPTGASAAAHPSAPRLRGLAIWEGPRPGRAYVIGADPAEGNPQSDESAACVLDAYSGDQAAVWAGRFEPAVFAAGLQELGEYYSAGILVERNNHGHAVLLALREGGAASVLTGLDGRPGWLSSAKGKPVAVAAGADLLRDGSPQVRDRETHRQLMALSGSTLSAPPGDHDDRAMAWCLAVAAARYCGAVTGESAGWAPPAFRIDTRETGGW